AQNQADFVTTGEIKQSAIFFACIACKASSIPLIVAINGQSTQINNVNARGVEIGSGSYAGAGGEQKLTISHVNACTTRFSGSIAGRRTIQNDTVDRLDDHSRASVINRAGREAVILTHFQGSINSAHLPVALALQRRLQLLNFQTRDLDIVQRQTSSGQSNGDLVIIVGTTGANSCVSFVQAGGAESNVNVLRKPISRIVVHFTKNGSAAQSQLNGGQACNGHLTSQVTAVGSGIEADGRQLNNGSFRTVTKNFICQGSRRRDIQIKCSCSRTKRHRRHSGGQCGLYQ